MNVLSLFDGISCGRVALDRAGINVKNYYASEIDKYATKISEANYPDIIRLGDVTKWKEWNIDWGSIDLLIGGSPCQGFSFAGQQLAFNDPRSALFFEFVNILNHIKKLNPNVKFLLENVRMAQAHEGVISYYLKREPELINSALVSAQNRERLYWTNWHIEQPADRRIILADIIEDGFVDREKAHCITASYGKGTTVERYYSHSDRQIVFKTGRIGNVNPSGRGMNGEVTSIFGKSATLTTNKGEGAKIGILQRARGNNKGGLFTDKEPTLTSNSWEHNNHLVVFGGALRGRCRVDGRRVDHKGSVAGRTAQEIELRADGKTNALTTATKDSIVVRNSKGTVNELTYREGKDRFGRNYYYRNLTPMECERLQTLPDGYTAHVSNSQRYKALGNGWTVDVIAGILETINIQKIEQGRLFA